MFKKRVAILEVTGDPSKRISQEYHDRSHAGYLRLVELAQPEFDAVIIPVLEFGAEETVALMDKIDALIIGGGEDIKPSLYNGPPDYPRAEKFQPKADIIERDATIRAIANGIPILGICRGMQLLNVIAGGTLIQDLGDNNKHRPKGNRAAKTVVTLQPSKLRDALGEDHVTAHCNHHQALDIVPERFHVVGSSGDVIEAIEDDFNRIYGVQWHPEAKGMPAAHAKKVLSLLA